MKKLLVAASLLGCATIGLSSISAQGDAGIPGSLDISQVAAGTYALDPAHTLVGWEVNHLGFNDYFGLFGNIEGTMTLDPTAVESAKFDITIPIDSVTVPSAGLRDHLLRPGEDGAAPDFFGAEPQAARFVSTEVTRTSDTTAVVSGQLSMNGRTAPVTMQVEFAGAGQNPMSKATTVGFHGRARIDRTDWGIDSGVPLVGRMVDLRVSAAFEWQ